MSGSLAATDAASAAVAVAPRVTLADIEAKIVDRYYFTGADIGGGDALSVLTICILVMRNGFTVIGKAAPASPENFNAQLGRDFAYEDAVRQIWPLEGYLLRESLHSEGK
jgi:Phage protein (N4 Gp49/phage Sf6 gene 66) family